VRNIRYSLIDKSKNRYYWCYALCLSNHFWTSHCEARSNLF